MKDVFVDNCVVSNLVTPLTDHYKEFVVWLNREGVLVVSNSLLSEYGRGNQLVLALIGTLGKQGRINKISNHDINSYRFPKKAKLLSNKKDHSHIKVICLSERKVGITSDQNFLRDVNSLPKINGVKPVCVACPSELPR